MKGLLALAAIVALFSCTTQPQSEENQGAEYAEITDSSPGDTLFRIPGDAYEMGEDFAYINQQGDTMVPFGRYGLSFTDTITTFGIVIDKSGGNNELIAINPHGQRLYEVFWIDNGPDYLSDGLFRIIRNGKIGYADASGKIVIQPQFTCAYPFEDGRAKVALDCKTVTDMDHFVMESDSWFYVDKMGEKTE